MRSSSSQSVRETVLDVVAKTPVFDIHTHLYDRAFGALSLWGIDELLTYHYLIAESLRWSEVFVREVLESLEAQQADMIWDQLFLQHSPISEALPRRLTTLNTLGLDVKKRDLPALRREYAQWSLEDFTTRAM